MQINALDLFCGAGGLTHGLEMSGINVRAGIDIDPDCEYPYNQNNRARFIQRDITSLSASEVNKLFGRRRGTRLLAGCAPCQPFSPHQKGRDTESDPKWSLLEAFGRLAVECLPEFVTMENVPRLQSHSVFERFVRRLRNAGYKLTWKSLYCPNYGVPQERRRLVLLASRIGDMELPSERPGRHRTVRDAIGKLPPIANGETHEKDVLHSARSLNSKNLERLAHSKAGGSWKDWPAALRVDCHKKKSGFTYKNVYGRMSWDMPSPTITTLFHNYGTGRFGHPDQLRAISLREGALLQSFPANYEFAPPGASVRRTSVGRLIGNAVPPLLAEAIGKTILKAAKDLV